MPRKKEIEYFSQCGQDRFLFEKIYRTKSKGFFVDVGAHDGVYISNTLALEIHKEWDGICVEPAISASNLVKSRKCKVVPVCVGDDEFHNKIVRFRQRVPSEISTTFFDEDDGKFESDPGVYEDRNKICRTLDSILLENKCPEKIDYLSIDTEGSEYRVIKDFPFDDWDIKVITIAHNYYLNTAESNYNRKKIKKCLERKKYKLAKQFTIHELDRENWGEDFSDGFLEDCYIHATVKLK